MVRSSIPFRLPGLPELTTTLGSLWNFRTTDRKCVSIREDTGPTGAGEIVDDDDDGVVTRRGETGSGWAESFAEDASPPKL